MIHALSTALYSRLQGTAITALLAGTTSIYHMQAPEGASFPYIVWNIQGGGDENLDANRTKNLVLFIRTFVKRQAGTSAGSLAGSIDAQVDAALHLAPLTLSGWSNIWLARESDLELVQTEPTGNEIYMAGGLYRCRLDKE